MNDHLKQFATHSAYEAVKSNLDTPNVVLCTQEDEVHYNPYVDPFNGHAYVDLGLPSGTKWATMNVGANSETDYGLYFQWGDTQGYSADQVGSGEGQKYFSWNDYKWTENGGSTMSKYNATDGKTVVDLEDDAARANWGGRWKMPTEAQFQELLNTANCTSIWTTVNGINGRLFTSVKNGNTLFIPAAGRALNGRAGNMGSYSDIWSSSLPSYNIKNGYISFFSSSDVYTTNDFRYNGYSIRPVVG